VVAAVIFPGIKFEQYLLGDSETVLSMTKLCFDFRIETKFDEITQATIGENCVSSFLPLYINMN